MRKSYNFDFRYIYQHVKNSLDELIKVKGYRKYVLYPNGEITRFVKDFLREEYQLEEEYVIDNLNYNGQDVLSIEQAKRKSNDGVIFLICSDNIIYYDEIRRVIYENIEHKQIFDIFPVNRADMLPDDYEIRKILDYLDELVGMLKNGDY